MKMKKRMLAGLLSAVMAVSSLQLSTITVLAEESSGVVQDTAAWLGEAEKEEKGSSEAEVLEQSEVDDTWQPETDSAQQPDADSTQQSDADDIQQPDADNTQQSDADDTQQPDADNTQQPDADNIHQSESDNLKQSEAEEPADGSESDTAFDGEAGFMPSGEDVEGDEDVAQLLADGNEEDIMPAAEIASGEYGQITWVLDSDLKLTVTGEGDFSASSSSGRAPWEWKDYILSAEINVKGMTNASYMFNGCKSLVSVDLSGFDTSTVTDMSYMFYNCTALSSIDLSSLDTGKVTDMSNMFNGCKKLSSINVSGSFNTSQVTDMSYMFYNCNALSSIDLSGFDTGKVTDMSDMFEACEKLDNIDLSSLDTSKVAYMSHMFSGCQNLSSINLSGSFSTSQVKTMRYMFSNCRNLSNIDLRGFDTSQVTDMSDMFVHCWALERIDIDVRRFDTSQVTDMSEMFSNCWELTDIDLRGFDTSQVTNMSSMFSVCEKLESIDVSSFDTSKVTSMNCMFQECRELTDIDLSGFDTSKVTNMSYMFQWCETLSSIDLSSFDTSQVTSMFGMFYNCGSLSSIDVGSFDTSRVADMRKLFEGCSNLKEIDLSSFDASGVTGSNMSDIFAGCDALSTIYTPLNVNVSPSVSLPDGEWYDIDGALVKELPQELGYSKVIAKGSKPVIEKSYITAYKSQTVYGCRDNLNIDDLKVKYYGADGTVKILTDDDYSTNASEIDMSTEGIKTLRITYNDPTSGKDLEYEIKLTVTKQPYITATKTNITYKCRDKIDLTDLIVQYHDKEENVTTVTEYTTNASEIDMTTEGPKTLVITYKDPISGKGLTYEITLTVTTEPYITATMTKTTYECGDEIDLEGLVVEYHDGTGNVTIVVEYDTNASDIDMSKDGTETLRITYKDPTSGKNLEYEIKLTVTKKPYITAIKTNTAYECGDEIDLTDLTVQYYDKTGNKTTVTRYTTNASEIDMTTEGLKTLVITYNDPISGKELTYEITLTVTKKEEDIEDPAKPAEPYIMAAKANTVYECGDEIDLSDLRVEYYDEKGKITIVTESEYSTNASEIDMSTEGTKTLVITYKEPTSGKEFTYEITLTVTKKSGSGDSQNDGDRTGFRIRFVNEADKKSVYTGFAIAPAIEVTHNGHELTEGIDYTVKYSNNVKASENAKITVTGKGNLSGAASELFTIEKKDLSDANVEIAGVELDGDGNIPTLLVAEKTKASPVLIYYGVKLTSKDFTVEGNQKWTENGSITIKAKANSNFSGERKLNVKVISKQDLKKFTVTVDKSVTYDGEKHELIPVVTDSKTRENLAKTDYTVTYSNDVINAGTVKVTVVGRGYYTGSVTKSYKIKPLALKTGIEAELSNKTGYTFKSTGVILGKEDLTVKHDGKPLSYGTDYKVTCSNNKKVGDKAKYKVTFLGNYKGSKAVSGNFTINKATLNDNNDGLKILLPDKVYTGKAGIYKSAPYVSINGVSLKKSDYTVTYWADPDRSANEIKGKQNNITVTDEPKTVYVKIVAKGNNYETPNGTYATAQYKVHPKPADSKYNLSKARVTLTFKDKEDNVVRKPEFIGDGIEVKAAEIKVECKSGKNWETVPASEYTVEYVNNIYKGKATVLIKAGGTEYAGSKVTTFNIAAYSLNK